MIQKNNPQTKRLLNKLEKPEAKLALKRARFAKFYDYDQNKFFDFYLQNGDVVLGYQAKMLNKALKSVVNRGYLYGAPSHLAYGAKKAIESLFVGEVFVYFFHSINALKYQASFNNINLKNLEQNNPFRSSIQPDTQMFIFSPSIANGLPIYALVSKTALGLEEETLSPLHYQAVISTMQEYNKGLWESICKKIMAPFFEKINYFSGGSFQIPGIKMGDALSERLMESCIYIHPKQERFYICPLTEPHQIAYLLKTINKIL